MGVVLFESFNALNISSEISNRNKVIFFSTIFMNMHICLGFMMALSCGYYQLVGLNSFIQRCSEGKIKMSHVEMISKASKLYDKICDAFDEISRFFLITNLIFLAAFNFFNIFYFYSVYVYFKAPSPLISNFLITAQVWAIYYAPAVGWMMTFSHWIHAEGCKTTDLVQKLASREKDVKTLEHSHRMVLLVAHRKPIISCGLYELSWKTFFAMLSSIFSFTIIVIQFYDVSNS